MITINQDITKKILLKLQETDTDFYITFSGKRSSKVNGLYLSTSHEIIIHNKNFKNNNQLIYTAIHEYSHHIMWCKYHELGKIPGHTNEFWSMMYDLLDRAETQGLYKKYPGDPAKEEIQMLVGEAKKIHERIASLYRELGKTIQNIRKKTEEHDVRLEDIITRECQINARTARMVERAFLYSIDEPLSQDMQQLITSQKDSIKIHSIIEGAKQGKTIYQVKEHLKTETQKPTNNENYWRRRSMATLTTLSNLAKASIANSGAAEKIVDIKKVLTQGICHALGKIHQGATVREVLEQAAIDRKEAIACEVAAKDIERLDDVFNKVASSEAIKPERRVVGILV